jgi:predicted DNA-binding transcriptional regulator YafY
MPSAQPTYSDGIQMIQMLQMLEASANRELRIDAVADRLEVHRRTVIRYVDALHGSVDDQQGRPIVERIGIGKAATVKLGTLGAPIAARIFQYAAVYAATRALTAGDGSLLGDSAEGLLRDLEAGLDLRLRPLARRVREAFVYVPFGPKDHRAAEDALDVMVQAVLRRHPVRVRYTAASGYRMRRTLKPYTLVMYRDGLYALARTRTRSGDDMRLFAVERISDAELVRDRTFEVPDDFDPRARFEGTLGLWQSDRRPQKVRIAFDDAVVDLVKERRWPGPTRWRERDDGRGELELRVPVTPEVYTWILTWGPLAEVLTPRKLRNEVAGALRKALAQYEVSKG